MIDHISIPVRDLERALEFYDTVLGTMGLKRLVTRQATAGYGKRYPEFWLNSRLDLIPISNPGYHVCLRARTEEMVMTFFDTAIALGAVGDGAPGERQGALSRYFGAFIRDADGNKIEVANFSTCG